MIDNITCFKLNWYDCGLCCAEDMVQEEITVYRNKNLMVFKELNGYGVVCSCEIVHIESDKATKFFDFLERTCDEWENDYNVEVCDGSEWKVRMWHSSHKVKKVCGTVEYTTLNHTVWKDAKNRIVDLHCFEYGRLSERDANAKI